MHSRRRGRWAAGGAGFGSVGLVQPPCLSGRSSAWGIAPEHRLPPWFARQIRGKVGRISTPKALLASHRAEIPSNPHLQFLQGYRNTLTHSTPSDRERERGVVLDFAEDKQKYTSLNLNNTIRTASVVLPVSLLPHGLAKQFCRHRHCHVNAIKLNRWRSSQGISGKLD